MGGYRNLKMINSGNRLDPFEDIQMTLRVIIPFVGIMILFFFLNPVLLYSIPKKTNENLERAREFQIKAISLEKFSMFVEWPKSSQVNIPEKPFVIGVLGDSPIVKEITSLYIEGHQRIKEKKVLLKAVSDKDEVPRCDLLFISRSSKFRITKVINQLKKRPVLIIGDTEGFAERGVHINFIIRNRALSFEVNLDAAKQSGLIVKYHLLKAASQVLDSNGERSNTGGN